MSTPALEESGRREEFLAAARTIFAHYGFRRASLEEIAREHVLSGGSIMSVIRFAAMQSLERGAETIARADVLRGVHREYAKEGKAT